MINPFAPKIYTRSGITKENIFSNKKVLHIGCGSSKLRGALGMDILKLPGVDLVHNLDETPWPVEDSSVDLVFAHSVVEHLSDIVSFTDEVWRVLKPGGRVIITVPYFRSVDSFTDITHKHFFTSKSFDYFIKNSGQLSEYTYTEKTFRKIGFWYGWPHESKNPLVFMFKKFIQNHRRFYDQYLSLLFPMRILIWELEVDK
ncbi:MAG: Alternative oxidase/tellurite resistance protein TehB [Parcubacteria bacterium C7867-005]|nr:MAG: Alternative oxidase/tellurite resistance protein TehB [Parcubacteria bacterium C7867-005]